ncbi:MAG: outer membrane protein assembly factor BamD [Desulfuromonadaceae bacterium]|nr:outer membrane protein assembly factor BamD [Desulfuromonadaceae bacterium]MDD2856799.1 outer membrane protein assembly factor BamD [Desulfuromonadaceae bacterium]
MRITVKTFANILFALAFIQGCSTPQLNKSADLLYKEGEQFYQDGRYEDAIAQWKRVKESYQSPELTAKAELGIADSYFLNDDFIEAAAAYEDFRKLHPTHKEADFALYRVGMSYFNQIHSVDADQTPVKNAQETFSLYMSLYPAGEYLADVQEKNRECRDKQLQYEIYVGRFYLKTDAYKGAIARFEESLKMFPDSLRRDEVLYYLGRAYLEDGQKAKGREVFALLAAQFPGSAYIKDANKAMDALF